MNKIILLIASYVPHQVITIKSLIGIYEAELHSFSISKDFEYIPADIDGLYTYRQEDFTKQELLEKILFQNPDILVTAGWMISDYVWVAKRIKKQLDIPVVAYSDTPWYGTFRQRVNALISPFHVKKAFTHIWVAGIYQYYYARKLGFANDQIIFHSLSADVDLFKKVDIEAKRGKYSKNFIYIGRFTSVKGLDILQNAWHNIKDKKGWTLTLVGAGEQKEKLEKDSSIIIKDYMNHSELINELQQSGCFVLPSRKEPWALVIHEAAAAGLPIVCTKTCGASAHFVIDGYNGYKVDTNSETSLQYAMEQIINADMATLMRYSTNSRNLSNSITPEMTAASLMQLLEK